MYPTPAQPALWTGGAAFRPSLAHAQHHLPRMIILGLFLILRGLILPDYRHMDSDVSR